VRLTSEPASVASARSPDVVTVVAVDTLRWWLLVKAVGPRLNTTLGAWPPAAGVAFSTCRIWPPLCVVVIVDRLWAGC